MPHRRRHGEDEDRGRWPPGPSGTASRRRDRLIAELPRYAPVLSRRRAAGQHARTVPALRRLSERCSGFAAARPLPRWRQRLVPRLAKPKHGAAAPAARCSCWRIRSTAISSRRTCARRCACWRRPAIARSMPAASGRPLCCGRTWLAAGMVEQARAEARRTMDASAERHPGHRAGALLPADLARRVPLAAARRREPMRWPDAPCC